MGLLDYFRSKPSTAAIAKERLQILVAHERAQLGKPNYLPKLQQEILSVVRKYVEVDEDAISVQMEQDDNCEILEVNIVLPDTGGRQVVRGHK